MLGNLQAFARRTDVTRAYDGGGFRHYSPTTWDMQRESMRTVPHGENRRVSRGGSLVSGRQDLDSCLTTTRTTEEFSWPHRSILVVAVNFPGRGQ